MKVDGRCHCGDITFVAEADPAETRICHCTDCQGLTGTAFRVVVAVPANSFKLLSGQPTHYEKTADSGARRLQAFCPKCGTSVYATAAGEAPKSYGLRPGTLAQREHFVPRRQTWCRSAQGWALNIAGAERTDTQ